MRFPRVAVDFADPETRANLDARGDARIILAGILRPSLYGHCVHARDGQMVVSMKERTPAITLELRLLDEEVPMTYSVDGSRCFRLLARLSSFDFKAAVSNGSVR